MKNWNLVNFRDLGNYQTKEGKKIQRCRLLRSGEPVGLTEETKQQLLSTYQLRQIIDFRGVDEREKSPDDSFPNVNYIHIDIFGVNAPSMENMEEQMTEKLADQFLRDSYQAMIYEQHSRQGYQNFLKHLLAQEEGSTLFHCFAGKDRTGFAAALILSLLDVDRETIFEDYLQTNELRFEANQKLIQEEIEANNISEEQQKAFYVALTVKPDYLEEIFAIMDKEFGGIKQYTKEILAFSDQDLIDLKKLYLEN